MNIISKGKSAKGLRKYQQDCFCYATIHGTEVLMVTDGNSGDLAEIISQAAVNKGMAYLCRALSSQKISTEKLLIKTGLDAINRISDYVNHIKSLNAALSNCGSTMTLIIISKISKKTGIFWLGDSPAWIYQNQKLIPLIEPHTVGNELKKQGQKTDFLYGLNSILTKCLGHGSPLPDHKIIDTVPATIVVGSDGIKASEKELTDILNSKVNLPKKIIEASLKNGSSDNITVIVSRIISSRRISYKKKEKKKCLAFSKIG